MYHCDNQVEYPNQIRINGLKEKVMKKLIYILLLLSVYSCSSSKKPRDFKLEYEVVNASNRIQPDWIEDVSKYEGSKGERYFVAESENAIKRLCIKSSTARASSVIAGEVAQEIQNDYTEVTRQNEDKEVEKFFSETLRQLIQTEVSGIRVINQYWEKRKFAEDDKGASKVDYRCHSLVSISESRLDKAINLAQKKTLMVVSPSIKAELEKKFSK